MALTPASAPLRLRRFAGLALTTASLAVIGWATLRPGLGAPGSLSSGPSFVDFLLNILLFLPLGSGLVLSGLAPVTAILAGALGSAGIEASQLLWVAGRFASTADLIANLVGASLGAFVVARWHRRALWWPLCGPVIGLSLLVGWFLGGYLTQPAWTGRLPWVVEWGAVREEMKPFLGAVLDVRLHDLPLPDGPVTVMPELQSQLSNSDTIRITMKILSGPVPEDTVRLLKINVGGSVVPYLDVLQHGRSLRGYQKLGLDWVGLRVPWLILQEVMPASAGDTVLISLEATRQRLSLAAAHDGVDREVFLRLSPDLHLSALFNRATDDALWWRFVPTLLYFALLGLALANRPKLLVAATVVAIFVLPGLSGAAIPSWPVIATIVLGSFTGSRVARDLALIQA